MVYIDYLPEGGVSLPLDGWPVLGSESGGFPWIPIPQFKAKRNTLLFRNH
jgi:hypothetical protein